MKLHGPIPENSLLWGLIDKKARSWVRTAVDKEAASPPHAEIPSIPNKYPPITEKKRESGLEFEK